MLRVMAMQAASAGIVENETESGPSAGLALCRYVRNGKLSMVDRGVGQAMHAAST